MQPPLPSPLFTGRDAELDRLSRALVRVSVAWVFGVAGVGKTTLVAEYAARAGRPVVFAHAAGASVDAWVDEARLALGPRARPEPRDTDARLADLFGRVESTKALLVVDDAHLMGDEAASAFARRASESLADGRVIFTSRHRLENDPRARDRLELRLEGLAEAAARHLWAELDELYGAASGFERALARSAGNPLLLRQAHAGGAEGGDWVGGEVAGLSAEARELGLMLAVVQIPIPPEAFARPDLLSKLAAALAVDVGAERVRLHDLFRESLLASQSSEAVARAREAALEVLARADLPVAARVRETTTQLLALGRAAELDAFLLERSTAMVQCGATGELLRAMDAVSPEQRSLALQIERARCLGRHFDMRAAYDELRRLMAAGEARPVELAYAFAEAAYDMCRAREVVETLSPLLGGSALSPEMRVRCLSRFAAAHTVLGEGAEGRRLLRAQQHELTDPVLSARLALHEAMVENADELYDQAAVTLGRARLLWDRAVIDENAVYAPLLSAVMYARAGRFAESDALVAKIRLDAPTEDESAEIFMLASRASLAFERGERCAALELRQRAQRMNQVLGGVHYDLVGAMWLARNLFSLGRSTEARAELERALGEANRLGCRGIAERLERTRCFEPRVQIDHLPPVAPPRERRGDAARHWSLTALRRAAGGDFAGAETALGEALALATGPGYGLDRAVCHLARGLHGDDAARRRARDEAERDGAEVAVIEDLERWARAGRASQSVVFDTVKHELAFAGQVVSLRSRPVLRRLLHALITRPGQPVTKDELVREVWDQDYDPRRHDTPLWQNIRRLRPAVAPAGITIAVDDQGYRLLLPDGVAARVQ
ncbi:MAG: winged helix-turn-helix domain-containing protein [Polyangiaceae bacterium]|nr:winged helix-turn-helix domain-containing protein [Polyangiaceae bacterium]